MYNKDEMETWIKRHFSVLAEPLRVEKRKLLNAPLDEKTKTLVTNHLTKILNAQNKVLEALHEDAELGAFATHYDRHYIDRNTTWEAYDEEAHVITFRQNGIDNYISEKLSDINKQVHKKEIEIIEKKLVLINNEQERLINWLNGIGYNSKMSDGNKQKAYDLLVEAGVDPTVMVRKFKYELSLTGIATDVTRGVYEIKTREQKIAEAKQG